jgi:hypothetical protein
LKHRGKEDAEDLRGKSVKTDKFTGRRKQELRQDKSKFKPRGERQEVKRQILTEE